MSVVTNRLVDRRWRPWVGQLDNLVIAIGLVLLSAQAVVWSQPLSWFTPLAEGQPALRPAPVTAVGMVLLTVASMLALGGRGRWLGVSALIAAAVALVAALILAFDPGLSPIGQASPFPVPAVLAAFALMGTGIATLSRRSVFAHAVGIGLLSLVAVVGLFRLLGWVAPDLVGEQARPIDLVSFLVSLWFVSGAFATIYWHPRLDIRRRILRPNLRGRILRTGLVVILSIPVVAGFVAWLMMQITQWGHDLLFAAAVSISVAAGAILVWWVALLVEQLQDRTRRHVAELSRANEALERYASSTAHDLKAPVRHLRVYSELIVEAVGAGEAERATNYAKSNIESTDSLLQMVERLLSYARSGHREMLIGEHRLSELVRAAEQLSAGAAGSRLRIDIYGDATIRCDGHLIETVFQNLLANSIAFGVEDDLMVRVAAERIAETWRIVYEDNGPGFDREFIPKAFDYLARAEPNDSEGSGIGLTTCKTIMTRHGGDITIDPEFTDGARLVLTLPVLSLSAQALETHPA